MQRACQAAYTDGPTSCSAATPRRTDLLLPYIENNGFDVESLYGDHMDGPLREGCPRLLVRAVRL